MAHLPKRVLFGAAYYHEYQPYDRLKTDLDLMEEAGFSVIRVGESVWSTWEPENGVFDLEWLQPVLDGAQERGISVVLGTPTYAVPPWLVRLYPEIAGERRTGERIPWGARQEVDFTHPGYLFHAERVIRKILARYADHPAVIGFQVDNEPGMELFHNHGVFQRFVDSLRRTYGDVETLNREWGLVYWSHRLSTWADLWTPDGNVQPQYDVAWRRFQAEQTTEFIAWQAGIAREYARPEQFVTTCIAYERPALDDHELAASLDITSGNAYYRMQDGLALPDTRTPRQYWTTNSTWAMYLTADRMYSSRQEPFLVTETNAMHIGFPWLSEPAFDGQWRQAAWSLVSRGARMIEYWHWHTLHFGAETYWGGVLPHNGRPGRTYREVARLGAELAKAGGLVAGLTPDADVTLLYSMPSKWLMQKYPALVTEDGAPDERAYQGFLEPLYRGAFEAGLQTRVVHAGQLVAGGSEGPRRVAGGRGPPAPGPGGAGVLRGRRRGAAVAGRVRRGRRAPGPRPADGVRRPRGPRPHGDGAGVPHRRGGRLVRRVQQRRHGGGDPGRTGLAAAARTGCGRHAMGRRPARRGRHRPRAVRPPALRAVAGGHHARARARPGHVHRHGAQPVAGPEHLRVAGADAGQRMAVAAAVRHRHQRDRRGRRPGALPAQLVLGRGVGAGAGDGSATC